MTAQRSILIVSTVGTSLLTNQLQDHKCRQVLTETANLEEKELNPEDKRIIDARRREVLQRLNGQGPDEWAQSSAEINGILSYLRQAQRDLAAPGDRHVLVGTKTYHGQLTLSIVREFLERLGCIVTSIETGELSAKDREEFLNGIARVAEWCHENLPRYREKAYKVVFNLTGGFKGVQGCLTALRMFYADEVVYIFERSQLIVIPRLPIRLEAKDEAERNAVVFGLLEHNRTLSTGALDAAGVSYDPNSAMLDVVTADGQQLISLSPWGTVLWNEHRKNVLSQCLWDWPYLDYSERFRRDFERYTDPNVRTELQEKLALMSHTLVESDGNFGKLRKLHGLEYDKLGSHPEYDHFRATQNYRVSCRPSENKLLLCRFGTHDDVNNNPEA